MATVQEARLFRRRIGFAPDDTTGMPQVEVDEIFTDAASENPESASPALSAVILYLEGLFVDSAKMVNFKKNQTQKELSDG